jgi:hypothetical protein
MDNTEPTTSKIETPHVVPTKERPIDFIKLDIKSINDTKKILWSSYYRNESEHYFEILAMTLGLMESGNFSLLTKNDLLYDYHFLFSTYIKMIDQDKTEFFAKKSVRSEILESLKRTIIFLNKCKDEKAIRGLLEELVSEKPSSFMIFPISYKIGKKIVCHASGMIVYRMNNEYVVTLIDKASIYTESIGNYVSISQNKITELVKVFCNSTIYDKKEPFECLKEVLDLSNEINFIPLHIYMKKQSIGNCAISEVEATVKTALFHCRTDMFKLTSSTPVKWNDLPDSTLKMRRQFANVIIGKDPNWDVLFHRLVRYYESRKQIKKMLKEPNAQVTYKDLIDLRKLFLRDSEIQSANKMSLKEECKSFNKLSGNFICLDEKVTSLNEMMQKIEKNLTVLKVNPIKNSTKLNEAFTKEKIAVQDILHAINKTVALGELLAPLKECPANDISPTIFKIKEELTCRLAQMKKKVPVAIKEIDKKTKKMNALLVKIEKEIMKINKSQTSALLPDQSSKPARNDLKELKQKIKEATAIGHSTKSSGPSVSEKDKNVARHRST